MATSYDSLLDIGAIDGEGQVINKLKEVVADKKCIMVVNIATHSHFVDMNFEALNELYDKYVDKGFEILAFPCN